MDFRYAQFCPLTRAVEILGERWTVLILRELFLGPKRFSDLRAALNGVSTSVLAERLARLEERGVVARAELPPPAASAVYELAEAGRALRPVLVELTRWGLRFLGARGADDSFRPEWLLLGLDVFARRGPSPAVSALLHVDDGRESVDILVRGGRSGTSVARGRDDVDVTIHAGPVEMLGFVSGYLSLDSVRSSPTFRFEGDEEALASVPGLFDVTVAPVEAEAFAPASKSEPRRRARTRPQTGSAAERGRPGPQGADRR